MNRLILTFFVFLLSLIANGQQRPDVLFFKDRLQPVSADNIFKTAGCYNWGPSIIKGKDGKYHLFYSRWSKEHEFTGWLTLNHVVLQEDIAFGERVSEFVRTQAYRCISSRSKIGRASGRERVIKSE